MKPREILHRVLAFDNPPRIGLGIGGDFPHDMVMGRGTWGVRRPLPPRGNELRRWQDEWGNTWASLTEFDKGEVVVGALEDWDRLETWQGPDLSAPGLYDQARKAYAAEPDQFRLGGIPGFTFNIARKLRRLDNYLCDLVLERERIERLHAKVRAILLGAIDRWAELGADAITFAEDWGTQDRLMVSPEMWREIFKPEFAALAGRAQDHGMRVIMHSCGKMTAVIEDMIETGVDCFQFDQPRLHGLDLLAERFAGRASFWCTCDIQTTLQTRDPDVIRAEVAEMIEKLHVGGGFIAKRYPSDASIGLDPSVQDIACQAFVDHAAQQEQRAS